MNPPWLDGVFDGPYYRLKDVLRLQAEVRTIRRRAASSNERDNLIAQLITTKRQAVERVKQVSLCPLHALYVYTYLMSSIACDCLHGVVRIRREEA